MALKNWYIRLNSPYGAPIDNERHIVNSWGHPNEWEGENLDRIFDEISQVISENNAVVVNGALAGVGRMPFFRYTIIYRFYDDGTMETELSGDVRENCVWLPRMGFEFKLPSNDDSFRYYGKGPIKNYCDMNLHTTTSWYESSAANEFVNYPMPQEHGDHTCCKKLHIGELEFTADDEFEINVSQYDSKMLTKAMHIDELKKADCVTVRIDYEDSGIGSNSCGPELAEKNIHFRFWVK